MKTLTAKDAKYGLGGLIDLARAEPVTIAKHRRPVVVVMPVDAYERLTGSVNADGGGISLSRPAREDAEPPL